MSASPGSKKKERAKKIVAPCCAMIYIYVRMQLIVMRVHPTYLRNEDDLDVWSSCVSWDFAP